MSAGRAISFFINFVLAEFDLSWHIPWKQTNYHIWKCTRWLHVFLCDVNYNVWNRGTIQYDEKNRLCYAQRFDDQNKPRRRVYDCSASHQRTRFSTACNLCLCIASEETFTSLTRENDPCATIACWGSYREVDRTAAMTQCAKGRADLEHFVGFRMSTNRSNISS